MGKQTDLQKLTRQRRHPNDLWRDFIAKMDVEVEGGAPASGDAAFALTAVAGVERALELALATHFVDMDEHQIAQVFDDAQNGLLTDLTKKTRMAKCLGVIESSVKAEIDIVRDIRNAFAHASMSITFETPEVVAECDRLVVPRHYRPIGGNQEGARLKFISSCRNLFLYLEDPRPRDSPKRWRDHPAYATLFPMVEARSTATA